MSELKLKAAAWAKLKAIRSLKGMSAPMGYASRKSADIDAEAKAIEQQEHSANADRAVKVFENTNIARFTQTKTFKNVLQGTSHDSRELARFTTIVAPVAAAAQPEYKQAVFKKIVADAERVIRAVKKLKNSPAEQRVADEYSLKKYEKKLRTDARDPAIKKPPKTSIPILKERSEPGMVLEARAKLEEELDAIELEEARFNTEDTLVVRLPAPPKRIAGYNDHDYAGDNKARADFNEMWSKMSPDEKIEWKKRNDEQKKTEFSEQMRMSDEASAKRKAEYARRETIYKPRAMARIGDTWFKLNPMERDFLIDGERTREKVEEFSNNPVADKKVEIDGLATVTAMELVKLNPKFTLIIKVGRILHLIPKRLSVDGVYYKINPKDPKYEDIKKNLNSGKGYANKTTDEQTFDAGIKVELMWWPVPEKKEKTPESEEEKKTARKIRYAQNKEKQRPAGAYFKYYHKLSKIDLRRYGIYRNIEEAGGYEKNCLEMALAAAGIPTGDLQNLMPMLRTRDVPQSQLKDVANFLQIYIVLTKAYAQRESFKYGNPEHKRVDIGLIDEHYFILDKTAVNSYPVINYFTENMEAVERDFGLIYKKEGNKFKRANRVIDSFKLIELLLEHKATHLTPITIANCGLYTDFGARTIDYEELPDVVFKKEKGAADTRDAKPVLGKGMLPQRIFQRVLAESPWEHVEQMKTLGQDKDPKFLDYFNEQVRKCQYLLDNGIDHPDNYITPIGPDEHFDNEEEQNEALEAARKYEKFEVIFFDTEATTDGDIHEPYLCRSVTRGSGEKRVFRGEDCALQWLRSLKTHSLLIAHNLRYDFQFMIRYLGGVRDIIQSGTHVRAVSGTFLNKYTGARIKLAFKDSLALITMPLRDFGKCFKLECEKDVMPYRSYTRESVKQEYASIDDAIKYICEDNHSFDSADIFADVKAFCKNIKKWNLESEDGLYFKHMEYSDIYCEKDCDVLAAGYDKFRGWILDMTKVAADPASKRKEKSGLDMDYAVSLPQIADAYGVRAGVFTGCYKISGVARDFIQRTVVGGRCMTRRNEKFKITHRGNDNDGVSLYPSAMSRLPGYLKGVPKVIRDPAMIANIEHGVFTGLDGVFVEVEILSVGIRRDFPLMSYRSPEGVRVFTNEMVGRRMNVDMVTLQDMKEFQQVTYKVIRGYYFNDGRNPTITSFMRGLFNERLTKKKEGNPIEIVYKLFMNSFYGKQIQKPIESDTEFVYGKEEMQKSAYYNFNFIKSIVEITPGLYVINKTRSINKHFSMPHCGSEVLSMSKRIMSEVMCLAEDNGIEIYYQDTDSMHIDDRSIYGDAAALTGSEHLANLFRNKYGREMTGKHLGQFHCDFAGDSDVTVYSAESVFLGKKSYFDKLVFEQCVPLPGESRKDCKARVAKLPKEEFDKIPRTISYGAHMRMKGSPAKCLHEVAAGRYGGDVHKMYLGMLEGDAITVDMISVCKFKTNKDFTTSNNTEFKRTLQF